MLIWYIRHVSIWNSINKVIFMVSGHSINVTHKFKPSCHAPNSDQQARPRSQCVQLIDNGKEGAPQTWWIREVYKAIGRFVKSNTIVTAHSFFLPLTPCPGSKNDFTTVANLAVVPVRWLGGCLESFFDEPAECCFFAGKQNNGVIESEQPPRERKQWI